MRTKIGRNHFEPIRQAHGLEHPDLSLEIQAVSALGFNRGRSELEKPIRELDSKFWGLARRLHAGEDPATAGEYIHI